MKRFILVMGLLCAVAFPCYAQNWTPQDSLRLNRLLKGEREVKLNPEVLQELEMNNSLSTPKAVMDKSWMDFDNSLLKAAVWYFIAWVLISVGAAALQGLYKIGRAHV